MYIPNSGYTPRNRVEMLQIAYDKAVEHGFAGSLEDFEAGNTHTYLSAFLFPFLEAKQQDVVTILKNIWQTMHEAKLTISEGYSSALLTMIREFAAISDGIYLTNKRIDNNLKDGEVNIYLDNAVDFSSEASTQESIDNIIEALHNTAWPGMRTNLYHTADDGEGNQVPLPRITCEVPFSNGQTFTYELFNLTPEDYTPIEVTLRLVYKANSYRYMERDIITDVTERLAAQLTIGRAFYPEGLLDAAKYPNLADMVGLSKIDGETDWVEGIRFIEPYQRLQVTAVTVSRTENAAPPVSEEA
jgi:hypothetical protein